MRVKITKLSPQCPLPDYATPGSSGLDVHSMTEYSLKPLERHLFPCGFSIEMSLHLEAQVRPRSGLALKHGITVLNTPGTIDSDYRGEVGVILINLSDTTFRVEKLMRIAQIVFMPVCKISWDEVEALDESMRGAKGFGASGL